MGQEFLSHASKTPARDVYSEMDVPATLERAGIKRGSGSWQDYERAKQLICAGVEGGFVYDRLIRAITDYLRI